MYSETLLLECRTFTVMMAVVLGLLGVPHHFTVLYALSPMQESTTVGPINPFTFSHQTTLSTSHQSSVPELVLRNVSSNVLRPYLTLPYLTLSLWWFLNK